MRKSKAAQAKTIKKVERREPWECLDDDLDESTVRITSEEETAAIDKRAGLQMISIRLEPSLIAELKLIADHHGVGYQPLIRDLLHRFSRAELQQIFRLKLDDIKKAQAAQPKFKPVDKFLTRERKRA